MIAQRTTDGYVNATAMCQANGKEFFGYSRGKEAQAFLEALARSPQICGDPLTITKSTGPNEERGTWVHPKVAIHLAMWCSADFSVWVISWIYDFMTKRPAVLDLDDPDSVLDELGRQVAARRAERLELKKSQVQVQNLEKRAGGLLDVIEEKHKEALQQKAENDLLRPKAGIYDEQRQDKEDLYLVITMTGGYISGSYGGVLMPNVQRQLEIPLATIMAHCRAGGC
jgi:hypothetical protein